jgi:hypothetical protein
MAALYLDFITQQDTNNKDKNKKGSPLCATLYVTVDERSVNTRETFRTVFNISAIINFKKGTKILTCSDSRARERSGIDVGC